eukprot:COSAG02_NODE_239_length_27693_cov_31.385700_14_plen_93_part_00
MHARVCYHAGAHVIRYNRAALASQGGPIVAVLSVSFWTPIARLTFGVYLTHIMIIRLLFNSTEKEFDYNDVNLRSQLASQLASQPAIRLVSH